MSYVEQELLAAVRTAATHPDAGTRRRAEERARNWASHVIGTLTGTVTTGVRAPVRDLPAWVTLHVLHGGFATGTPAAGGPLSDDEHDLARDLGLPRTRTALNEWHVTDAGRARLTGILDSGRYRLRHPENAVLLVVAWLARAGDQEGATELLRAVAPFTDRLRFYPVATTTTEPGPGQVFRRSQADTHRVLASRTPNPRVEAQREALTVWAPFADELLALWWPAVGDGPAGSASGDDAGRRAVRPAADGGPRGLPAAADLAAATARYRDLAARHPYSTRHTRTKTNLGVLVRATVTAASDGVLSAGERSRVAHAVRSMIARRGVPGSAELAAYRERLSSAVAAPSHAAVAHLVATRLDAEAAGRGVPDPGAVVVPVADGEATADVPSGAAVPESVVRTVGLARQATIEELHVHDVVPSAEVLAELAPQLVAAQHAATYPDEALGTLMSRVYRAFRERRSVLLVDLSSQVRLEELPWVAAVHRHRMLDDSTRAAAAAALRRIGGYYLRWFGDTPLPNPLLVELEALARHARLEVLLVPELAADIFQDAFSPRFARAASFVVGQAGAAYLTYYDLSDDLRDLAAHGDDPKVLAAICRRRAEAADAGVSRWSVSRNGMVVEQAQLMTSHNLAQLAALGVTADARSVARSAFDGVLRRVKAARRPGAEAYVAMSEARAAGLAWRHVVWFVARLDRREALAVLDEFGREAVEAGMPARLADAVTDLRAAVRGVPARTPLLGWSNGPHPLLAEPGPPGGRS